MSYGCVPVVINKAGQKEIVDNAVNGYLWNTLKELRERTLWLTERSKDSLLELRVKARKRSEVFNRNKFNKVISQSLGDFVD